MENASKIHYSIKQINQQQLDELINAGIDTIILESEKKCTENEMTLIKGIQSKVKIIVKDNIALAKEIGAHGVLFSELHSLENMTTEDLAQFVVGGIAFNLADCKNWELFKADYIHLDAQKNTKKNTPNPILGTEGFENIIPKKVEYGWMVASINIPVFATGIYSVSQLTELVAVASIYGMTINESFKTEENLKKDVPEIKTILSTQF